MKCYYHEDRNAVATCQHCGKSLCKECASRFTPILCEDCYEVLREEEDDRRFNETYWTARRFLGMLAVGIFFGVSLMQCGDANEKFLFFIFGFGVPFGWVTYTRLAEHLDILNFLNPFVLIIARLLFGVMFGWLCFFYHLAVAVIMVVVYIKDLKAERESNLRAAEYSDG